MPDIVITIGARHVRRIDRLNRRQIRKFAASAVRLACRKMRAKGIKPLSLVDDVSMYAIGPWFADFGYGLTAAALREGVSVVGGETAQMSGTYRPGYVGVVVYVVGVKQ